jgi:flagellar biogenesis protein FliO
LGGSLGLSVLVVVFASNNMAGLDAAEQLARHVDSTFVASALMLALALVLVLLYVVRPLGSRRAA